MFKLVVKTAVMSVGVYALNEYFKKTQLPEKALALGVQFVSNFLTHFAAQQAAEAAAARSSTPPTVAPMVPQPPASSGSYGGMR